MKEAFLSKWLSADTRNGRECDVFELDPNPDFHPHSMFQNALSHVTAKISVDHESNQLVWGEAHVMSDISVGGGILGKVYRGSRISMGQGEVAPGIWLPTHYQYDFTGRKFLFAFQGAPNHRREPLSPGGAPQRGPRHCRRGISERENPHGGSVAIPRRYFQRDSYRGLGKKRGISSLSAGDRHYRAAAAISFSMGAPTRLPHSVHEPS